MSLENTSMDPALEQAVSEIRDEPIDPAVVESAAARVWEKISAQSSHHIRTCADFQALIPEYRAKRLPDAKALLLEDHLHNCVACRRVFEGRVVSFPAQQKAAPRRQIYRWAVAAGIVAAAGLSVWIGIDQYGGRTGHAIVQTVNGQLFAIGPDGIRVLAANQDLPDNVEIRTAKDSDATLQLRDGSQLEMRERSGFTTWQSGKDLTIRLNRGSVIVQAARRRSSHLYVVTADCRVAVTGTVFSVDAGVKGSRVSVLQGEVHVSQENQEKVLHPGDQTVTSPNLEPLPIPDDIAWSRNRDHLLKLIQDLRTEIQRVPMPGLRYSSKLLPRLPASTGIYASIPNLGSYLADVQSVIANKLAQNPELRSWWSERGGRIDPILDKLRAASDYLGDEIAIVAFNNVGPVFFSELKRDGFPEFLKQQGLPIAVDVRNGLVAFGPRDAVEAFAPALNSSSGGFEGTPFYSRINAAYQNGAGLLVCADLNYFHAQPGGVRYLVVSQTEANQQPETRASITFDGPRTGVASWLAAPASMGSLDYISPEATFLTAFVVKSPAAIVNELASVTNKSVDVNPDLTQGLGGEFAVALDGPPFPVPSWKLVTEVYDPARVEAGIEKLVHSAEKPLRTSQEVVNGRTFYMIGAENPNPLLEAHYTFADGYLIAGPTRDIVTRALQVKQTENSIKRSSKFIAMAPHDHYTNFSAVVYQNLGTTLAPLVGLLGAFAGGRGGLQANQLDSLGNIKPTFIAAYGEPDRITIAGEGDALGLSLSNFLSGNLMGMSGRALPFGQMQMQGARR